MSDVNIKPKLIMLCGLSGSGKSTYARDLIKHSKNSDDSDDENNTLLFSSDDLRQELFGDVNDQSHNQELFQELHRRIKDCIRKGNNAIYDATNVKSKLRIAFLNELKNIDCFKSCHIIYRPYNECLLMNRGRTRSVPDYVITRQYMNWHTPWYFEGWDEIKWIGDDTFSYYFANEIVKYNNFLQHNHHHELTLGRHCFEAKEIVAMNVEDNLNLTIAAWLHDIGKPFTKTFKDSKGNPTKEAHYYQHHCVGAYDALGLYYGRSPKVDKIKISAYITYHMHPYFWKNPKTEARYRKRWGNDFFNDIMLLHEADKLAH